MVLIEQQIRGAHINLALAFSTYTAMKVRFPHATVRFVAPIAKFKGYESYLTFTEFYLNFAHAYFHLKDSVQLATLLKKAWAQALHDKVDNLHQVHAMCSFTHRAHAYYGRLRG